MRQIVLLCLLFFNVLIAFGQESILDIKNKITKQLGDSFVVEQDDEWIFIKSKNKVKLANTVSLPNMTKEERIEELNKYANDTNLNYKLYFDYQKLSEDDFKLLAELKKKIAPPPGKSKNVSHKNIVMPEYFNKSYSIYIFKNISLYSFVYREEDIALYEKLIKVLESMFEKYE